VEHDAADQKLEQLGALGRRRDLVEQVEVGQRAA
jgi:hypothetical protein